MIILLSREKVRCISPSTIDSCRILSRIILVSLMCYNMTTLVGSLVINKEIVIIVMVLLAVYLTDSFCFV